MKAWQLTTGLAVLAIAAGQLDAIYFTTVDLSPPVRAQLDRVVGTADYGFVGPEERLSVHRIDDAIHANRDLMECFDDARQALGPFEDVMMQFHVGPTGAVDDAKLTVPAQLQGSGLDACLARGLEAMRFAPVDGGGVWFHFPFKF